MNSDQKNINEAVCIPDTESMIKNDTIVETEITNSITEKSSTSKTAKLNGKLYDKGGVKRIFSPFNKFSMAMPLRANKMDIYRSPNAPTGLSGKEMSYIMASCQSRASRYLTLKALAANAIKHNKVFSINGSCDAVRTALLERGWVEKKPLKSMNLSKIRNGKITAKTDVHNELEKLLLSNLVDKCTPNFVWYAKDEMQDNCIDMSKECNTIFNKLRTDGLWTTKQGLCTSIKGNYWFYIEDVSEVNGPRTYSSSDSSDLEDFEKDYKLTACTSLLKWILSMAANDRPIFLKTGKMSLNIIVFALNRCKEYLFRKQNKDIDKDIGTVSPGQWAAFLRKYYCIISKEEVFQVDTENKLPIYLGFAKFLLKEIHRYRPQLSCEGAHNIWIIKPAHNSRGRGIRLASKLGVINKIVTPKSKYVVQKYIEEPLLIYDTKFDIRQYYLVTSTHPLVIWMYKDCYLKFSSQKYNLKNFHESIHLTNNAVQRKYTNCKERHPELPQSNMWHLDTYKKFLQQNEKEHVWEDIIYPGMKKTIIGIMLCGQDSLPVSKNRFELYGCDFILDKDYKPWLIEVNSCPDLNHTTEVTSRICPEVITDIIKVVIDRIGHPKAPTGKFRCIYRQPSTTPRYCSAAELVVRGYSLPNEYFYKGNVNVRELYDNADIEKERDIKAILKKLKKRYDTDIMKQPDVDGLYIPKNKVFEDHSDDIIEDRLKSDEFNDAVVVITKQLGELIDRITENDSHKSPGGPSSPSLYTETKSNSGLFGSFQDKDRNNNTLQKNILQRSASAASFSFSKLNDSCSMIVNRDTDLFHPKMNLKESISETNPQAAILRAAFKVISFLEKKEIEYYSQK